MIYFIFGEVLIAKICIIIYNDIIAILNHINLFSKRKEMLLHIKIGISLWGKFFF